MKKMIMILNIVLISILLFSCGGNNEMDDSPNYQEINWSQNILKNSSVNMDGVEGIGLAVETVEKKSKPLNSIILTSVYYDNEEDDEYMFEKVNLVADVDGEVKNMEFLNKNDDIEYDIFRLLVEEEFTYFTISPRTKTGEIFKLVDGAKGEQNKNFHPVSRLHPDVQVEIGTKNPSNIKMEEFDRTGYVTNEIFQSYILDNVTGTVYEFPKNIPNNAIVSDNLIITDDHIIDIKKAIENDDNLTEAIPTLYDDMEIRDVFVDKNDNIYAYTNKYDNTFNNDSIMFFSSNISGGDLISKMFLSEDDEVYIVEIIDDATNLYKIGNNLERNLIDNNVTIFSKESILDNFSTNDHSYGVVKMFKNGKVILYNSNNRITINNGDNIVKINDDIPNTIFIVDDIFIVIEIDSTSINRKVSNIYYEQIETIYDNFLDSDDMNISLTSLKILDISEFNSLLSLDNHNGIVYNDGKTLKKYELLKDLNSGIKLLEIFKKEDSNMIIEMKPISSSN